MASCSPPPWDGNGSEGGMETVRWPRARRLPPGPAARDYAASGRIAAARQRAWLTGEPDFWRLWMVGLVVFAVRWLEMLAVAVFAYQRTGSPLLLGPPAVVRAAPQA